MNEAEQIIFEIMKVHPSYAFIQNILSIKTLYAIRDIFASKSENQYAYNKKQIERECGTECIKFLEECKIISKSIDKTKLQQNKNDCLIVCFLSKLKLYYPIDSLSLLESIGDKLKASNYNEENEKLIVEYYKKEDSIKFINILNSIKDYFKNQKYSTEQVNFVREIILSDFFSKNEVIIKNLQNKIKNYNNQNSDKIINFSYAFRNLIILSDKEKTVLLNKISTINQDEINKNLIDIFKEILALIKKADRLNEIIKDYNEKTLDKDFIERCIGYLLNNDKENLQNEENNANNKLRSLIINSCYDITLNDIKNAPAVVIPTLLAQMDGIVQNIWNILKSNCLNGSYKKYNNKSKLCALTKFLNRFLSTKLKTNITIIDAKNILISKEIGYILKLKQPFRSASDFVKVLCSLKNVDIPVLYKFYFYSIIHSQIFTNNYNNNLNSLIRNNILHGSDCFYNLDNLRDKNLIKTWLTFYILVEIYDKINEKYKKI